MSRRKSPAHRQHHKEARAQAAGEQPAVSKIWPRLFARLLVSTAVAVVVVLASVKAYGWLSLQRAQRQLAIALGNASELQEVPVGREGTAARVFVNLLEHLEALQETMESARELAMLGSGPMTPDQRKRAEDAVWTHSTELEELATAVSRPTARMGLWDGVEPEIEGTNQAGLLLLAQLAAADGRLACELADVDRFERSLAVLQALATCLQMESQTQPLLVGLMVESLQHLLLARGLRSGMADLDREGRIDALLVSTDLQRAYRRVLRAQVARLEGLRSPPTWTLKGVRDDLGDLVFFDLHLARALDSLREATAESERSVLAPVAAAAGMPSLVSVAMAGTLGISGRIEVVEAGRGLALAALAVRRHAVSFGAYPRTLDDLEAARKAVARLKAPVIFEHRPDRGASLRVPGADENLRVLTGDPTHPPLLTWELPPAARPAG